MRRAIYRGADDEGRALFHRARAVHLALAGDGGRPILRTVDAVVLARDGAWSIAFHGAPAGEKMEGLGRDAVAQAEEVVASIPSYFVDPARACPATTYYVSAQAHGPLHEVTDPERKAEVLTALMQKYQPEGGHVPIAHDHPLYAKAIRGLLVAEVRATRIDCKAKLGQNRTPAERVRVLEGLWRRGAPGDVGAIATILARFPELPTPAFLRADGTDARLSCHLEGDALDEAAALLEGAYWLAGVSRERVRAALAASAACVGARDADGRLVSFARATSDGRTAWIYDVVVRPDARRTGVGAATLRVLLDHPAVRGARVRLTTRDARGFYARFGFGDLADAPRPWPVVEMVRA